jgi:hypothetical protein
MRRLSLFLTATALRSNKGGAMPTTSSTIPWTHELNSALTRARANQRPILVDFTAAPM